MKSFVIKGLIILIVGIFVGIFTAKLFFTPSRAKVHVHEETAKKIEEPDRKLKYWTCSMHPQIKLPEPGKGPICGMDLIPVYEESGTDETGTEVSLKLGPTAQELAEVETFTVRRQEVFREIRLVGKVDYDESRIAYISAWVPGRIDRLYVDFTGIKVWKGDHLIYLYSPELYAAQAEYIQAIKTYDEIKDSDLTIARQNALSNLESSKEKLRLYGLTEQQIKKIANKRKPDDHLTIFSSITGTVIQKNGFDGMYVKTGDRIYTIADLSRVWVFIEAYERDIQWIHYGQDVVIETESFPGEKFKGKVAFIEPFLNEKTRTVKVRVNVDNLNEKLKPGMFVHAIIHTTFYSGGEIYEADLAGKLICPMHPDVVKDKPGPCDICGMDLVKTSEFGFASTPPEKETPLVIPKTAPLITGKRAVIYVERETDKEGVNRYVGREIVLGPRAGDFYIVKSGLQEGEKVVTSGNFKIDSALQLLGKPSMMSPSGYYHEKETAFGPGTGISRYNAGILQPALLHYFDVVHALNRDDPEEARRGLDKFKKTLASIIVKNNLKSNSSDLARDIVNLYDEIDTTGADLQTVRLNFAGFSLILKKIMDNYEYLEDIPVVKVLCPTAFGKDEAYWFQDSKEITNPYLGQKKSSCGIIKTEYGRKIDESKPATAAHKH